MSNERYMRHEFSRLTEWADTCAASGFETPAETEMPKGWQAPKNKNRKDRRGPNGLKHASEHTTPSSKSGTCQCQCRTSFASLSHPQGPDLREIIESSALVSRIASRWKRLTQTHPMNMARRLDRPETAKWVENGGTVGGLRKPKPANADHHCRTGRGATPNQVHIDNQSFELAHRIAIGPTAGKRGTVNVRLSTSTGWQWHASDF